MRLLCIFDESVIHASIADLPMAIFQWPFLWLQNLFMFAFVEKAGTPKFNFLSKARKKIMATTNDPISILHVWMILPIQPTLIVDFQPVTFEPFEHTGAGHTPGWAGPHKSGNGWDPSEGKPGYCGAGGKATDLHSTLGIPREPWGPRGFEGFGA